MTKYIATATRRNVAGKPDYRWVYSNTDGTPVLFDTADEALAKAKSFCADPAYGLYNPVAEEI